LAANAPEETELLKNHGPGDDGKNSEKHENAAGDPAGLRENAAKIG
jgi:hypothetical protein